jgi:hypothetical protein
MLAMWSVDGGVGAFRDTQLQITVSEEAISLKG